MRLIIGGAYQGKATWAAENWKIEEFGAFPTAGKQGQCHLEAFSRDCTAQGVDPVARAQALRPVWQDCVIISREVGSGVVPLSPEERKWREDHGRLLQYLAREATCVVRVFCGLGEVLG